MPRSSTAGPTVVDTNFPNAFYGPADVVAGGYQGGITLAADTILKMWSGVQAGTDELGNNIPAYAPATPRACIDWYWRYDPNAPR